MAATRALIEDRRVLGIGLGLVSYFLFTCIDGSAKWLALAGIPAVQIAFLRYSVHLGISLAINIPRTGTTVFRSANLPLALLRAICLLASTLLNFIAISYLPLTTTSAIMFTMPLMLSALSVPLLGEQVGWRRWTAIFIGFLGILVIVRPGTTAFHPAALLSLGGAFFSALYFILTRRLAAVDSIATQQIYPALVATLAVLPFVLTGWVWPDDMTGWILFFLVGVFGFLSHQFSAGAHRFAPASLLAPFSYTQIIWMSAVSWLVFAQPPDAAIIIGAPIIIGSGLNIWLRERQLKTDVVATTPAAPER